MPKHPSFTLQVPGPWLSAIINGDESSFDYYDDPKDYAAYQAFCEHEIPPNSIISCDGEAYFAHRHDASGYGVLACNVVDCTVILMDQWEASYQDAWFHDRQSIQLLPQECIDDCSAPGQPADDAVAYWIKKLQFTGPAWLIREYLSGYGAWDAAQLCDHNENLERLLWVWACDCHEAGQPEPLYLMR